jgi:tellurite resistance protein
MRTLTTRRAKGVKALTRDQAVVALLIGAMTANGRVSAEEAARAHHLIWSTKMFRRKPGQTVDRLIDGSRTLIERHGPAAVIATVARAIPAGVRAPVFAIAADLVLADGKIEPSERRFLDALGRELALDRRVSTQLITALLVKNSV